MTEDEPSDQSMLRPFPLYYLFVHVPIVVAGICVPVILAAGWPAWAGFGFAAGLYVIVVGIGLSVGTLLAKTSNKEQAAHDKVPGPKRCDRCHEVEPKVCPKPWHLSACPLRSIETGQTYQDFM